MTIGTALVVVAMLAIIAWQVDKRGAWKIAGKVALWSLMVLALMVGAIVGYVYWTVLETEREFEARLESEQREVETLASEGIKSYLGVSLGMQKNEVAYVLGEATTKNDSAHGDADLWTYDNDADPTIRFIMFDAGKTVRIACGNAPDCPRLAGISMYDSESAIIERLGPPPSPAFIDEKGVKHLRYGPPTGGVAFLLRQDAVFRMGVYREVAEESH